MACQLFVHHASLLAMPANSVAPGTKKAVTSSWSERKLPCDRGMSSRSTTEPAVSTHMREHMLKCFDKSPHAAEAGLSSSPYGVFPAWHHRLVEVSLSDSHCCRSSAGICTGRTEVFFWGSNVLFLSLPEWLHQPGVCGWWWNAVSSEMWVATISLSCFILCTNNLDSISWSKWRLKENSFLTCPAF